MRPIPLVDSPQIFSSFWLAGFESGSQINQAGMRLDMIASTQHDRQVEADYARLRSIGITTARDAARWHLIDRAGHYDFSSFAPMLEAAQRQRIQVIWALCHYGWPDDVDVFAPAFVDRFARFSRAVARFVREHTDGVPYYTPINEMSYLAWAAGDAAYFHPFASGRGYELKMQLTRAAIAAMEEVWAVDRRARFVHVDPIIHIAPQRGREDLADEVEARRLGQFQSADMLVGRMEPHLGGHPRYLDIVGVNFYHNSEWEYPGGLWLGWAYKPLDDRWRPPHQILAEVYARYGRPLFIAETSHYGAGRAAWLRFMMDEVGQAWALGVPIGGVTLFPVLDRHDWDRLDHWHNSGLWDLQPDADGVLRRALNTEYADELRRQQAALEGRRRRAG